MRSTTNRQITTLSFALALTAAAPLFSQESAPPPPSGPQDQQEQQQPPPQQWRRFQQRQGDPSQQGQYQGQQGQYQGQQGPPQAQQRMQQQPYAYPPPQMTIPAGAWITVRTNQVLSSDHSHPGDLFDATLVKPIIVDGFVVARQGQTIAGRVVEAEKAGRVKGTSRLAVEVTELSLVDGQQIPVKTSLSQYAGGTTYGRDGAAIATTTGVGAAIGASVNGGVGAGVGAAGGLVASVVGVLVTRGRATEIYPESVLTFRLGAPVTISTERSGQAFHAVQQNDYSHAAAAPRQAPRPAYGQGPIGYYGWGSPWPYAGYGYGYPYYGSSIYFGYGIGGRHYGGYRGGRRW